MPVLKALSFETKDMNSNVTALMIYAKEEGKWIVKGKATSGKSNHAEEELVADLKGDNVLGIKDGADVYIEITKSPCHEHDDGKRCSLVLADLKRSGRVGAMYVRYLGLYKSNSHSELWRSIAGIVECEDAGIDTGPWNYKESWSALQITFLNEYIKQFKAKKLGGGFWTNPESRYGHTQKVPSKKFWDADL